MSTPAAEHGKYPPATPAAPGDPVSGNGYMVKLSGNSTISGGDWSTDNIAGITLIYWRGSHCWIDGAMITASGANTIGL